MSKSTNQAQELIEKANRQLFKIKLRIKPGRNTISLRGVFPPKPGDGKKCKRYEIGTGLPPTPEGVRIAKARAKQLEAELLLEKFSWDNYLCEERKAEPTVEEWLCRFERAYWQKYERTINRIDNFQTDYLRPFSFLPPSQSLSEKLLRKTLSSFPPESRERLRCYHAYNALVKFAKLDAHLQDLRGEYRPKIKRDLPTDEQIEQWRHQIECPQWQWVYSLLAIYGIRPHEVFKLNLSYLKEYPHVLSILNDTKTGERLIYPVHYPWAVEWEIWNGSLPPLETEGLSNKRLGSKVSSWFNRQKWLPLTPYYLRDAFAVRCAVVGIQDSVASMWMGHDLNTHYRHYQKHINRISHTRVWERSLSVSDYLLKINGPAPNPAEKQTISS